jgi:hypothetical protein
MHTHALSSSSVSPLTHSQLEPRRHPAFEPFAVTPVKRRRGELVTIRLFISSTFVDTHGERDALIKQVRKCAFVFIG